MMLLGGAPFLFLGLPFLALAFVAARSFALLSGVFIGLGGTWLGLTIRAQLACDAFDTAPNQGCTGYGVWPFLAISAAVLAVGLLLGAVAWRRRPGHANRQTRS
jgi:hypothetical protein